jgi:ADP-ribose pyrophosphatase YjhB (NUDIX family)
MWHVLCGPGQWYALWIYHAKFMAGITGLIRDDAGRVLLLRHRLWPEDRQWGLPTGYANKRERFEDTIVREVREETGLEVQTARLAKLTSGYKLRIEVAYVGQVLGGDLRLSAFVILKARWFDLNDLPDGMLPSHRQLLHENADWFSGLA